MKFTVPITFDIDPAEWADDYDLPNAEAAESDILGALTRAAEPGALDVEIVRNWPMMRDAATVTIGAPTRLMDGSEQWPQEVLEQAKQAYIAAFGPGTRRDHHWAALRAVLSIGARHALAANAQTVTAAPGPTADTAEIDSEVQALITAYAKTACRNRADDLSAFLVEAKADPLNIAVEVMHEAPGAAVSDEVFNRLVDATYAWLADLTVEALVARAEPAEDDWTPQYEPWRHGGWYVTNVSYPNGAVGCVSRNYRDRKWRIVCENTGPGVPEDRTFPTRDAAARAERDRARDAARQTLTEPAP